MPDKYLKARDAAQYLTICRTTLRKLLRDDPDFPAPSCIGRRKVYAVSDLDAYMQSKKPKPVDLSAVDPRLEAEVAALIERNRERRRRREAAEHKE